MKSIEECLDIILTHLSKNWDVPGAADRVFMDNQAIMREFDLPGQYLKHEFFKRLIDKLVKDDNAEFIAVNNGFPSHEVRYYEQNIVITVEGFLFLKNEGGYTKKKENEIKERDRITSLENRQDQMARRLFWINLTIALGTTAAALYYLNELCKSYHWCSFCH